MVNNGKPARVWEESLRDEPMNEKSFTMPRGAGKFNAYITVKHYRTTKNSAAFGAEYIPVFVDSVVGKTLNLFFHSYLICKF